MASSPLLISLDEYSSWSTSFEKLILTVIPRLKIPIFDGYVHPTFNAVSMSFSRMNAEEKVCYELEKKAFALLSTAISKEIFKNFKKIRKSKDLWIAIANVCNIDNEEKKTEKNDVKDQIDELIDEVRRLKEVNVGLRNEINELKMKSELREMRTDDDKYVSVVTESPSTVVDQEGFCAKGESKSKSKPIECQKSKVKTKKKRKQRKRSRKSTNKTQSTENVDIIDLFSRAFNDYRRSQKTDGSLVHHSRFPCQYLKRNHFRNYSDHILRNPKNFHAYVRSFQQTRDSRSYSPGFRE